MLEPTVPKKPLPELFVSFEYSSRHGGTLKECAVMEWDRPIRTEDDLYELQGFLRDWKGHSDEFPVNVVILFFRRVEE